MDFIFSLLLTSLTSSFCFVERRRGAAGLEDEKQGLHGGGAMCFYDCESLAPALVIWMVKKRLVIRALERPAECREEGAEGERMDHGW